MFWDVVPERESHVNVGSGEDIPIAELAHLLAGITGFEGRIGWDTSRPDGAPRKLLDVGRIRALGWRARIPLEDGLRSTLEWMRENLGRENEGSHAKEARR